MNKYVRLIFLYGIFITGLFPVSAFTQSIRFYGEKIEISVGKDQAICKGIYHFQNNSDQYFSRTLYYPFVINSYLTYPDSISVQRRSDHKNVAFRCTQSGIIFVLEVPAKSSVEYEVCYVQKVPHGRMEYILTTTRKWERPLVSAEYVIFLPVKYQLLDLSLKPDSTQVVDGRQIIRIYRNAYMPDRNLSFSWK